MINHFYRDTWAEIRLDYIERNIRNLRSILPETTEIMAVVKANAYGHGATFVAKEAVQLGCKFLAVAILDEALQLRKNGIQEPILVLGLTRPEYAPIAAKNKISLTAFQKDWIKQAESYLNNEQLNIHIKCDTGMGRIGLQTVTELRELIETIRSCKNIAIEGIFTHFAAADSKIFIIININ